MSGTGIVAEGIQFSDGRCVIRWMTHVHSADLSTPAGIDAFVDALQVLFPERERTALLNAELDTLMSDMRARAETLAVEASEASLRINGQDALTKVQKMLGLE